MPNKSTGWSAHTAAKLGTSLSVVCVFSAFAPGKRMVQSCKGLGHSMLLCVAAAVKLIEVLPICSTSSLQYVRKPS